MKCNQSRPGFELVSPCPFPLTNTITPRAPPNKWQLLLHWVTIFNWGVMLTRVKKYLGNNILWLNFVLITILIVSIAKMMCSLLLLYIYLFTMKFFQPLLVLIRLTNLGSLKNVKCFYFVIIRGSTLTRRGSIFCVPSINQIELLNH